jgi:pyruvate,water dikinase
MNRLKGQYIVSISDVRKFSKLGADPSGLFYLSTKNFSVPETYAITSKAYEDYTSGNEGTKQALENKLQRLLKPEKRYSIRLLASGDRTGLVSAKFRTRPDFKSAEQVFAAVQEIWQSIAQTEAAVDLGKAAVLIQETVDAKLSGIVFTKDPIAGMDEVVVESVLSTTDSSVQQATPDRWVYKWGAWRERPEAKRHLEPVVMEVAAKARKIGREYGKPLELEWAYDGEIIYWLSLREIGSIKRVDVYSNRLAKERLPGITLPLVWSVAVPLVNNTWKRLFTELVGKDAEILDVDRMAKSFYYRAYFNMGVIGDIFELLGMPRESIELMLGFEEAGSERPQIRPSARMLKYTPHMAIFAFKKVTFTKQLVRFLETHTNWCLYLNSIDVKRLEAEETLSLVQELYEENMEASYFLILTRMLMGFFSMLLKRQLDRVGVEFDGIDFSLVSKKLEALNPDNYLTLLRKECEKLPKSLRMKIKGMSFDEFAKTPELKSLHKQIARFLSRFGHMSDSGNDFSKAQWREVPQIVLSMMVSPSRAKILERQKMPISRVGKGPLSSVFLRVLYNRASEYREYSERLGFLYAQSFALFRPLFLHAGEVFVENGFLKEEQDIFFLTLDEIRAVVRLRSMPAEVRMKLLRRKQEVEQYKDAVLPEVIFGDTYPAPSADGLPLNRLEGVPASSGYYKGRTRIVMGVSDFDKVKEGEVLVVPYSDPSWTPLLAKAGAIISESGGILSHCAIIARERNVPAVVSVKNALRLKDGIMVTVDGYKGRITVDAQIQAGS